jgi:hypothetical protein
MTPRPWTVRLDGKDIGVVRYARPSLTMPQWCNGVCYLVKDVDYKTHIIIVEVHPKNAGK